MSKTLGPVLAMGAITVGNEVIVNGNPFDFRVPIATAIAAGMFSLAEKAMPRAAEGLAWLALVTVLFVRINKNVPAPAESFADWWKKNLGKR